jgi:Fe-S-cluster containining protein
MTQTTSARLITVANRRRRVHVPDQMRLADLARMCVGLDQWVVEDAARASRRMGKPASCRKGCTACCHHAIPLSPPEAWMLADLVNDMPPARREAVLSRFAAARAALSQRWSTPQSYFSADLEYRALAIPCPFLDNDACSIHAHRPAACREHMVTTPSSHCLSTVIAIDFVALPLRISTCLSQVAATLLGTAPTVIPLTGALEWTDGNRTQGAQTWDARQLLDLVQAAFQRSEAVATASPAIAASLQ